MIRLRRTAWQSLNVAAASLTRAASLSSSAMAADHRHHAAGRHESPKIARKRRRERIQAGKQQLMKALQLQQHQSSPVQISRHQPVSARTVAAENLLHLLQTDATYMDSALQAPADSEPSLQADFQSFYTDSLSSFAQVLVESTNPELEHAMERLMKVGFDNFKFGKHYRRTLLYTQKYAGLGKQFEANQASIDRLKAEADSIQKAVEQLRFELLEILTRANENAETEAKKSIMNKFVNSFLESEQERNDRTSLEAQLKSKKANLSSDLRFKERLAQTNRDLAMTAEQQMHGIERDMKHTLRNIPLSEDEMRPATLALEQYKGTICDALAQHIRTRHAQMIEQFKDLDDKTDLTKPHEWYPYARLDRRKIIYHGGPTNSGKTYEALERLKQAKKGMYLGPLRLLAVEVFEKLTAAGVYCSLYTGQEIQKVPFETHGAATVEMASLTVDYDIIVIDEIQMISDKDRGFAWTRALLGSRCKEIHVCGGLEAKELVERISAACGDEFELRTYERFTGLTVAEHSLAKASDEVGSYKKVQPGDCVVAFSRKDIFAIKREIETQTSHKCCVIYGSLPPLTRTEQARRFNDPDSGYDVLVASDAVGMGLNLNIRRIVFNSMYKQDGTGTTQLNHSMVKQISGRAGRRNSPFPEGQVTCRSPEDMPHLRKCMSTPVNSVQSAGLVPTAGHVELFHQTISSYGLRNNVSSLHSILGHFSDMAKLRSDYFLCRQTPMMIVAKHLEKLDLPISEKYTLCMSPVVESSKESIEVLRKFASKLAAREVPGLPQNLRPKRPTSFDDLSRLCSTYSHLELFLWLQNKFPPVNLIEQQAAISKKERTIELIGEGLTISDKLKLDHSYISRDLKLREESKAIKAKMTRQKNDDADKWMVADV